MCILHFPLVQIRFKWIRVLDIVQQRFFQASDNRRSFWEKTFSLSLFFHDFQKWLEMPSVVPERHKWHLPKYEGLKVRLGYKSPNPTPLNFATKDSRQKNLDQEEKEQKLITHTMKINKLFFFLMFFL